MNFIKCIQCKCLTQVLVILLILIKSTSMLHVSVGAIFDKHVDGRLKVLEYAVREANERILSDSDIILKTNVQNCSFGHPFDVSTRLCSLLEESVGVVFGPAWPFSAAQAISICDAKEIPFIETHLDEEAATKRSIINMHPSHDTLGQLLLDLIKAYEWKKFTILYQSPSWLQRIYKLLDLNNMKKNLINVHQLVLEQSFLDFRPILTRVKRTGEHNLVVSCSSDILPHILNHALQVGIITEKYNYIINNLDADSVNLIPYRYGGANFTTFRIISTTNYEWQQFNDFLQTSEELKEVESRVMNQERISSFKAQAIPFMFDECVNEEKILSAKKLQNALIYDGVMTFARTIQQLGRDQVETESISCKDRTSIWMKGLTISNFMRSVKFNGLTGPVEFDNDGARRNIRADVLELKPAGFEKIGNWQWDRTFQAKDRLEITRKFEMTTEKKTLVVIMSLTDPYAMLKDSTIELSGNDRYEGYGIDLIDELSRVMGFKYDVIIQDDGNYGVYDNISGQWDGMIGKIRAGVADLAITDLTMTSERIHAIDFSPSIMNLGIAILYRRPSREPPSTFSFMSPFAKDVWIYLAGAYLFVSICFFVLGRISPSQWESPYPCVEEPTHLENQFTFQNSLWFAIGALLQQGSEIEPKAASVRLVSSVWWFFTLIMISTYTANLAACLTVEEPHIVLKGIETLRECVKDKEKGCPVQFGAKSRGSTLNFFKSHEPDMYEYMTRHEHLLTKDNKEGLEKVLNKNENYAFLMESSTIQYHTERICNITQIGDLIDDKNYAIGMRKNYEHYGELSKAVLLLQEQGVLDKIHTRWWKQKKGGGACTKKEESRPEELGMMNMQGVFYVLGVGIFLAFIYGCIEKIIEIYRGARRQGISFRAELKAELKFLLKSYKNIKPIQRDEDSLSSQSLSN